MQYKLKKASRFKKDYKKISRNITFDEENFIQVLNNLAFGMKLHAKYKDHKLKGVFKSCKECHLQNDILLIYKIDDTNGTISLLRIGSHSELF